MDDRDKNLTYMFVRDLDEIPLPPRGEWRRPEGRESIAMRTSRYLLTAGAIGAVLAVALIIGFQLRDRSTTAANPSASPTPALTGLPNVVQPTPTANPNVSPTPSSSATGAIYNDDFGFVVIAQGGSATIRKESSNEFVGPPFAQQSFAVSPDGKFIAVWKPGAGASGEGAQLRMFSVGGNSTEQTLVTLAADQRGGGIAWSSDGAGLLYSTETGSFGIGGGTNSATLGVYELAASGRHGTTIDTQTNTGWLYRPIAWDRSVNLATAGLTGEGAAMAFYVTVRINPDNSFNAQRLDTRSPTKLGIPMGSVRASSDAKFVLGVDADSGDIKWWPLADFAANRSQAGAGKRGALWRPGTHEIGFMSSDQLWLGDVDKAGSLGLCCTAFSGAPATSTLRAFRADGSAVVLNVPGGVGVGQTQYVLVRLGSDPKSTSGDRVTFQELPGIAASIRFR